MPTFHAYAANHMALQFANKWGSEVHAFTTSDDKRAEAHNLLRTAWDRSCH